MAHWCSVLPLGTLLEVPYEQLVADQEGWTIKMLDFIGLTIARRMLRVPSDAFISGYGE